METDAKLLLPLLAVRMLGGEEVDKADPTMKAIAKLVAEAKKQELLTEAKKKVPDPGKLTKAGKPATKTLTVYSLSDKGKEYLEQSGSAEAQLAGQVGVVAELKQQLESDRQELKEEVQAAVAKKDTGSSGPTKKDWDALVKKVDALAQQMDKMGQPPEVSSPESVSEQIDAAFKGLTSRLEELTQGVSSTSESAPSPPAEESFQDVLRKAYDHLCLFTEFRDGLVEIPRLYHETKKTLSDLSVKEFHDHLMEMWENREVQLHILNEVYKAAEPDIGIRHNEQLYYYLLWEQS